MKYRLVHPLNSSLGKRERLDSIEDVLGMPLKSQKIDDNFPSQVANVNPEGQAIIALPVTHSVAAVAAPKVPTNNIL